MPKKYDLNRMRKTYPLIRKKPRFASLEETSVETAIIDISDGLPKKYTFQNTYLTIPVCVAAKPAFAIKKNIATPEIIK